MQSDLYDKDAAWNRATAGMSRAAEKAEDVSPGWQDDAVERVRLYAQYHERFLAEDVDLDVPADADPRATGAIMQRCRRLGYIECDGYLPARSSNLSPKRAWKSRLFRGVA